MSSNTKKGKNKYSPYHEIQGQGWVRLKGDGFWTFTLTFRSGTEKSFVGKTKAECRKSARDYLKKYYPPTRI